MKEDRKKVNKRNKDEQRQKGREKDVYKGKYDAGEMDFIGEMEDTWNEDLHKQKHKGKENLHKQKHKGKESHKHKNKRTKKNKTPTSPQSPHSPPQSSHSPPTLTPYQILGLTPSSSKDQIHKTFTKLRIKYHPDRKTGDREKYDQIVEAYNEIKNKREKDEEYLEVNSFIKNYKDSEEEIKDLLSLYEKFKGNYKKIMKYHLLTEEEDEERIRRIIEKEIGVKDENVVYEGKGNGRELGDDGKVKNSTPPSKKRIKEKKKAEKLALEMGIDLNQSLEEILNKGKKKEKKFLEDLERKYLRRLE